MWGGWGSNPIRGIDFSFSHHIRTGFGAHLALCLMGTGEEGIYSGIAAEWEVDYLSSPMVMSVYSFAVMELRHRDN